MVEVLRPRRGIGEGAGQAPLRVAETRWCVFVGSLMPAPSLPFPARADLARVLISPARRDASTPIGRTGAAATSCRPTPLASRPRPSTSLQEPTYLTPDQGSSVLVSRSRRHRRGRRRSPVAKRGTPPARHPPSRPRSWKSKPPRPTVCVAQAELCRSRSPTAVERAVVNLARVDGGCWAPRAQRMSGPRGWRRRCARRR